MAESCRLRSHIRALARALGRAVMETRSSGGFPPAALYGQYRGPSQTLACEIARHHLPVLNVELESFAMPPASFVNGRFCLDRSLRSNEYSKVGARLSA